MKKFTFAVFLAMLFCFQALADKPQLRQHRKPDYIAKISVYLSIDEPFGEIIRRKLIRRFRYLGDVKVVENFTKDSFELKFSAVETQSEQINKTTGHIISYTLKWLPSKNPCCIDLPSGLKFTGVTLGIGGLIKGPPRNLEKNLDFIVDDIDRTVFDKLRN